MTKTRGRINYPSSNIQSLLNFVYAQVLTMQEKLGLILLRETQKQTTGLVGGSRLRTILTP